ncbi:glycine radical domain-containing protein [Candidatus Hydrogenedentota bacterium]
MKAQEDPEKYGNIPVRVAGYSQMFNLIDRDLQDHIISRTKHRE